MDFLRLVLSDWVEMNFDDVDEGRDRHGCLRKSGQSLGDSGRNQRNADQSQRDNHRPVDDRHQMNRHSRSIVFWSGLESKNVNVPDNKGLDGIVDHELVSTHRKDRRACLKGHYYGSTKTG